MIHLECSAIYHGIHSVIFASVTFIGSCIALSFDVATYLFLSLNTADYIFAIMQKVCCYCYYYHHLLR